ncbi:hypothetical protein L198_06889, partial [Cryptococcus wingfieldii CBS 7118]
MCLLHALGGFPRTVRHLNDDCFVINLSAFHNVDVLWSALPPDLCRPRRLLEDPLAVRCARGEALKNINALGDGEEEDEDGDAEEGDGSFGDGGRNVRGGQGGCGAIRGRGRGRGYGRERGRRQEGGRGRGESREELQATTQDTVMESRPSTAPPL